MARSTVAEALKKLAEHEAERAVWQETVGFLRRFVDSEVRKPEEAITTETGSPVPQEVIQRVIDMVQGAQIEPLTREIKRIQGQPVSDDEEEKEHGEEGEGQELVAPGGAHGVARLIRPTRVRGSKATG